MQVSQAEPVKNDGTAQLLFSTCALSPNVVGGLENTDK